MFSLPIASVTSGRFGSAVVVVKKGRERLVMQQRMDLLLKSNEREKPFTGRQTKFNLFPSKEQEEVESNLKLPYIKV